MARSRLALALALIFVLLGAGCPGKRGEAPETAPPPPVSSPEPEVETVEPAVTVQYYGHACFLIKDSEGMSVAIDPFNDSVGYTVPSLTAEVCLVTHDHGDHSNVGAVSAPSEAGGGPPTVVREAGETQAAGVTFMGVTASHHEPGENEARGDIVMFRWEMDGIALAHLGDLGTDLTSEQIEALGSVDVLMVPVGGHFTIDAPKAVGLTRALAPKVVIPMHYKTEATSERLPIAPVEEFLSALPGEWLLASPDANSVTIATSELEKPGAPVRVIALGYE